MSSIVTSKMLASGAPAESGYTHGFFFLGACTALAAVWWRSSFPLPHPTTSST